MTPSCHCAGCRYPLDGLSENRCPECGRPFDHADPASFATSPKKPWARSAKRAAKWLGAIAAIVAALYAGLDWETSYETCRLCGTYSQARHLTFYGLGGGYGRKVTAGEISARIDTLSRPARQP